MGKYSRFKGKVAKGLNGKSSRLEGKVLEVCRESSQGLKGKYSRFDGKLHKEWKGYTTIKNPTKSVGLVKSKLIIISMKLYFVLAMIYLQNCSFGIKQQSLTHVKSSEQYFSYTHDIQINNKTFR